MWGPQTAEPQAGGRGEEKAQQERSGKASWKWHVSWPQCCLSPAGEEAAAEASNVSHRRERTSRHWGSWAEEKWETGLEESGVSPRWVELTQCGARAVKGSFRRTHDFQPVHLEALPGCPGEVQVRSPSSPSSAEPWSSVPSKAHSYSSLGDSPSAFTTPAGLCWSWVEMLCGHAAIEHTNLPAVISQGLGPKTVSSSREEIGALGIVTPPRHSGSPPPLPRWMP